MVSLATVIIIITILTALFHISLMNAKTIIIMALLCGLSIWFLYPVAIVQNKKMLINLFESYSVADISLLIVIENILLLGVNWFQMHKSLKIDKPLNPKVNKLLNLGTYFPGISIFFCLFFVEVQVFLLGLNYDFKVIALAASLGITAGVILVTFLWRKIIAETVIRIELTCLLRCIIILTALVFASSPSEHRQMMPV